MIPDGHSAVFVEKLVGWEATQGSREQGRKKHCLMIILPWM